MSTVNLLALDTATEACSAAVQINGAVHAEFEISPQQHSQKILPMVEAVLGSSNASLKDVDYLVFGRGPGSFTGVRIAVGMVQGLALGTGKRAIGVSTLAAMAQQTQGQKVAVAIDARMGEVYYGEFEKTDTGLVTVGEERVIAPEAALESAQAFAPDAVAGTGWAAYPELGEGLSPLTAEVVYPSAEAMLVLAQTHIEQAKDGQVGVDANKIEPIYLRDKVTWKKLPGK